MFMPSFTGFTMRSTYALGKINAQAHSPNPLLPNFLAYRNFKTLYMAIVYILYNHK